MDNLTKIIEAIVFASGSPVPVKYIVEKLNCTLKEVNSAISELKNRYSGSSGIHLLTFNGKLQFATNPDFKTQISEVLTPIKEKELTKAILECAAIIAYKQPITKPELEELRQVSCDYPIRALLELQMIEVRGKKDTVGKPILYGTTDIFLKRFKLNSISELPDYDDLMAQMAELNGHISSDDDDDGNYLYKKDEYFEEAQQNDSPSTSNVTEDGYELPDSLTANDDIIKID